MSNIGAIDQALTRLRSALSALETAAAKRAELDRSKASLETELALMQDDRARLAVELDGALARSHRLDAAAEEISVRIDRAMTSIRAAISGGQSRHC